MRLVIQRVRCASVTTPPNGNEAIGPGLMVLVGVARGDEITEATRLAQRTAALRIFDDEQGRMNLALDPKNHSILAVSQFTLYGDTRKGNRPSYIDAAPGEEASTLFDAYVGTLRSLGLTVRTGWFGEHMVVSLENDGPVTIIMESPHRTSA